MDSNQIWNLLGKYFSGEANLQERNIIEEWVAESEENHRIYEVLKSTWQQETVERQIDAIDTDKYWLKTKQIIEKHNEGNRLKERNTDWKTSKGFIKYAAAAVFVLFAFLSGIFLYQYSDISFQPNQVYESGVGESLSIELEDGSEVILAPGSMLSVSSNFNAPQREVSLEGEAYFSVEHDDQKPFQIHTGTSITTVLGTEFNISAYPENLFDEVVVIEGSVSVQLAEYDTDNQPLVLKENDLGKVGMQTREMEHLPNAGTQAYLKWLDGTISIDDIPMSEVTKKLERWYPIQIKIQPQEIRDKKLTAEFSSKQPLSEVLDAISLVLNIEYKKDQKEVTFYK